MGWGGCLYLTLFLMKAPIPFLLALKYNYELLWRMRRGETNYFVSHVKYHESTAQIRNVFFIKVRKERSV